VFHYLNCLLGSSPDAWTHSPEVKPNGRRSTAQRICSNDILRGRSSPIEKTIPSWLRHACEVLCVKGGCVGGSPIGAFKGLWSSWVRHLGAVSGGDSMTGSIKSPRARNPAARTTIAVASPTRPAAPARPCLLRHLVAQAQGRKQQLSSLQVLVEAPRSLFLTPCTTFQQ
jgi:hypothetical protein